MLKNNILSPTKVERVDIWLILFINEMKTCMLTFLKQFKNLTYVYTGTKHKFKKGQCHLDEILQWIFAILMF